MNCPKDAQGLRTLNFGKFAIDVCHACGGVWLDADELQEIASKFAREYDCASVTYTPLVQENDIPDTTHPREFLHEPGVSCLNDHISTQRVTYAGDSHVTVEWCPRCGGVWLDGDELVRVVQYLAPHPNEELVGSAMFSEMQDFEHLRKDIELLPVRLKLLLASPVAFLAGVLRIFALTIINMKKEQEEKA